MGIGRQSVAALCIAGLLLQLTSLNPSWSPSIPQYQVGESTTVISSVHYQRIPYVAPATLALGSNTSYDSAIFVGDVLLARNVEALMKRHGTDYPFAYFDPATIAPNPLVVGNFEASIPPIHAPTPTGGMSFSVATSVASVMSGVFDVVSLANNHSFDHGSDGFVHTVTTLEDIDVVPVGNARTVTDTSVEVRRIGDTEVAIIALHALVPLDPTALKKTFSAAKQASDYQIVYVHWGEEYDLMQNQAERDLARSFITLGADLIIGHHPHVTQGVERIDGVLVFYSLGNFLFDQYFSADVQDALVLALEFGESPTVYLEPFTSRHALSQPRPMTPEERWHYLTDVAAHSDPQLQDSLMDGAVPLFPSFATSPKTAMISQ